MPRIPNLDWTIERPLAAPPSFDPLVKAYRCQRIVHIVTQARKRQAHVDVKYKAKLERKQRKSRPAAMGLRHFDMEKIEQDKRKRRPNVIVIWGPREDELLSPIEVEFNAHRRPATRTPPSRLHSEDDGKNAALIPEIVVEQDRQPTLRPGDSGPMGQLYDPHRFAASEHSYSRTGRKTSGIEEMSQKEQDRKQLDVFYKMGEAHVNWDRHQMGRLREESSSAPPPLKRRCIELPPIMPPSHVRTVSAPPNFIAAPVPRRAAPAFNSAPAAVPLAHSVSPPARPMAPAPGFVFDRECFHSRTDSLPTLLQHPSVPSPQAGPLSVAPAPREASASTYLPITPPRSLHHKRKSTEDHELSPGGPSKRIRYQENAHHDAFPGPLSSSEHPPPQRSGGSRHSQKSRTSTPPPKRKQHHASA